MLTRLAILASRVRGLVTSGRQDREFDREVADHLDMLTDDYIRRGVPPGDARRQAILRFGGSVQIKEQQHEDRGMPFIETTLQDVRYGLRTLRKSPAYSLVAIATLAIGIGAGTAVFSVVGAVLLRPLPFTAPDELVRIFETNPLRRWISASWGISENNRKAKFYAITRTGRKQLAAQARNWERISAVMMRMLRLASR